MTLRSLEADLQQHFSPPAGQGLDAVIRLNVEPESLTFRIADGAIEFLDDETVDPDVSFFFADATTARELLTGQADAMDAFMEGRFRADGYLTWSFLLVAMFPGLPRMPSG